jgi:hypothetical protein
MAGPAGWVSDTPLGGTGSGAGGVVGAAGEPATVEPAGVGFSVGAVGILVLGSCACAWSLS